MENNEYKYYAFISYKSDDVKWAKWLQKRMEQYSLPVQLQHKHSLPRKLTPVFRDGTDIRLGELKNELADNLRQSRYLIVLCSPKSAASDWVGDEIEQFCQMGRRDNVIALIIDGKPYSNDPSTECYHPTLRKWFPKGDTVQTDRQLLGADIHSAGPESNHIKRERAFMQVLSTILQISYDELWNRRKRSMIIQCVIYLLIALAVALAITTTWLKGRPFDTQVTLNEITAHNENLPFTDGLIILTSGQDTLGIKSITAIDQTIKFTNIPGKFKGTNTQLHFQTYGYRQTDTLLTLAETHTLNIYRDDTFAIFAGTVTDDNGSPIAQALISIDNAETLTDDNGNFQIRIPIKNQAPLKHVIISKTGYTQLQYDLQPQRDHCIVLQK